MRWIITAFLLLPSSICHANTDINYYRNLFKNAQFLQLEKQQQKINQAYVQGEISWTEYYPAFDELFYKRDLESEWLPQLIERLESSKTDSAYRLLNLGIYYTEVGFNIRGRGYINTVSRYKQRNMQDSFVIAKQYLDRALELDPSLISAYQNLVRMAMTSSSAESVQYIEYVFQQGLKVKPDNYALAVNVLISRLPKWGGSYEKIAQTMTELHPYFVNNLGVHEKLKAIEIVEKTRKDLNKNRYRQALKKLAPYKSLMSHSLQKRFAQFYRDKEQWQQCFEHASNAVRIAPHSTAQGMLGYCSHKLEKWQVAQQAFTNHARYYGVGAWNLFYLANAYMQQGKFDIAYPLFKESIIQKADYRQYAFPMLEYIENNYPTQTNRNLTPVYQQLAIGD